MPNLIRVKQVDNVDFSGFFLQVGNVNYYPLSTNPSGYIGQGNLNSATGTINATIASLSGTLATSILNTGVNSKNYTDTMSGVVGARILSTGSTVNALLIALSGYVDVRDNVNSSGMSGASGLLNTKINTLSGAQISYTNTVSGVLFNQIVAYSNSGVISNIVSGTGFHFTGTKFFDSTVTVPRLNISGVTTPNGIALVSASGSMSIIGTGGTFMSFFETGSTNSLYAVADSAGIPMLELFDDYTLTLGHASRKSITMSGLSGYVIMPNLPFQTQTGGLPSGTLFRSGQFLMII